MNEVAPPSPSPAQASARPARPRWWRRALRTLERYLALAGLLFVIYHAGFGVSEMTSGSMAPTLCGEVGAPDNDWILYERLSPGPPARGKLVVFQNEDGVIISKRVVAFPGERVRVVDHRCLVDDVPLLGVPEGVRYIAGGNLRPTPRGNNAHLVEPDTVYVLGDDSRDSWDSRWTGGVPRAQWRGRVVAIVWPPARWRWLW